MVSLNDMPSPSSVFSAYASMSASIMLFKTMFHQLIPSPLQNYVVSTIRYYLKPQASTITLVIEENESMARNQIYDSAEIYLCTKVCANTQCLKISKTSKAKHLTLRFARSETIFDSFEGIGLTWRYVSEEESKKGRKTVDDDLNDVSWASVKQYFELTFEKKHKDKVLNSYVPFVLNKAKLIKDEKKVVKLHTLSSPTYSSSIFWDSVNLEHPSTFEKLAMEPVLKRAIVEDLDRFLGRREFYKKVGKAWKRGYLLYGPPGTGKSSLIAAMANYLKFDVYDLQLMNIKSDFYLRKLLLSTANRSILVIEDIDCSVALPDRNADKNPRESQFSLSGLLNFMDGLWSSCGDERIIIFTTNNKDRLDPALLRPGRMDMHIHMSYLTPHGFRLLASNYLDIQDDDRRFGEIEELIEGMKVTPAEVAEELMKNSIDADVSLQGLVNFLKRKTMESNELTKEEKLAADGIQLPREAKRLKTDDGGEN